MPRVAGVDVVLVADEGDSHAACVQHELNRRLLTVIRWNLSDLRCTVFTANQETITFDGLTYCIDGHLSVWYRRLGRVDVTDFDEDESDLVYDEAAHVFIGALSGIGVRWIDEPSIVHHAEFKQTQLFEARSLQIPTPLSIVTNDKEEFIAFVEAHRTVAKPLSPGIGISPFTAEVTVNDVSTVSAFPTLLQELIPASADIRAFVVDGNAWMWRRSRKEGELDWRQVDDHGDDFVAMPNHHEIRDWSLAITAKLGLTMGVLDWLETDDGPIFLEINPQGSWLFLRGSEDLTVPALADHLSRND